MTPFTPLKLATDPKSLIARRAEVSFHITVPTFAAVADH